MEELVEMCDDEKVEKCVIKHNKGCEPKCVTLRRKVCRTVNTKQCRRRTIRGKGKRKCVTKRVCDYQWEAEGEAEVMVEVPGSCREVKTDHCGQDIRSRQVCEDTPVNICEEVVEKTECDEFIKEDCNDGPILVCNEETEVGCRDVIKKVRKKVSRRAERKICREGKTNLSSSSIL